MLIHVQQNLQMLPSFLNTSFSHNNQHHLKYLKRKLSHFSIDQPSVNEKMVRTCHQVHVDISMMDRHHINQI